MSLDLHDLLTIGRPLDHQVAVDGSKTVRWRDFIALVQSHRAIEKTSRRRVLIAGTSPLDFLAKLLATLADHDVPVIPPNFQAHTLQSLSALPAPSEQPDSILEFFTSGSTGEPKRVQKTLRQLEAECEILEHVWGEAAGSATVVSTAPYHHIYGLLFRILWPFRAGRTFDNATIAEPATFVERLEHLQDTVLISSPAYLSRLPHLIDLRTLNPKPRLIFSSGGPLAMDTAACYSTNWKQPLIEVFGSTETGGVAWREQYNSNRWTPLPKVQLSADETGALIVRSPFLPDESPFRMEDAVEFETDGTFSLLSRLDRTVKIEEKRLSLPEMETWLQQHPDVTVAAVTPITVGARMVVGAVIVASDSARENRKHLVSSIKNHLRQKFDAVLLPRRWRFVDRLPYNECGKVTVADLVSVLSEQQCV